MEAIFYCFVGRRGVITYISENNKKIKKKDLPPHVFGDSGRETSKFSDLALKKLFLIISFEIFWE